MKIEEGLALVRNPNRSTILERLEDRHEDRCEEGGSLCHLMMKKHRTPLDLFLLEHRYRRVYSSNFKRTENETN